MSWDVMSAPRKIAFDQLSANGPMHANPLVMTKRVNPEHCVAK
jgi:hypothetical protein